MSTTTKSQSRKPAKSGAKQERALKVKKTGRFPKELLPESATRIAISEL